VRGPAIKHMMVVLFESTFITPALPGCGIAGWWESCYTYNPEMKFFPYLPAVGWLLMAPIGRPAIPELDPAGVEFFETRIRPVLAEFCYECHSAESSKLKAGLRVDDREGLLKGGDSGPALVPGHPEQSLLLKAMRHADPDLTMPPKKDRLAEAVLADFETWIRMGAPDPRTGGSAAASAPAWTEHWAFQPIHKAALPHVTASDQVRTPVDAFVLAKLEEKGLGYSPLADKRALIRRATYDLTGLPPTPEEVEAFVADTSPEAYARLVNRLLDSPQYGERWGRYWLDVARYADTKGYLAGGAQRRFDFSFTYRDYVVQALNEDLPFNRFIVEQIAADHLKLGDDKRPLAALGYLTLGRRFLNNQHDIIDDRIDVVTRGMMGLTVTCARCHDHKFDPVPAEDYYSLYGVFENSREPDDKPLLGVRPPEPLHQEYLAEVKRREVERDKFREEKIDEALAELRKRAGDYLWCAQVARASGGDMEALARENKLVPMVVRRWMEALKSWEQDSNAVMTPWFALAPLPEEGWKEKAADVMRQWSGEAAASQPMNPVVTARLAEKPPESLRDLANRYAELFQAAVDRWNAHLKAVHEADPNAARPEALPETEWEAVRQFFVANGAPVNVPRDETRELTRGSSPRLRELQAKVDEVDTFHPGAPPRAMALVDDGRIRQPRVFRRGNPNNRGDEVPIQFLGFLAGDHRQAFTNGSGRLELAEAIVAPDNPLTTRVLVNRVWMHHFGRPLVLTPSDFGTRAEPPSHPLLLDYLAATFMEQGWSLKSLHRTLMLSTAYQQSSLPRVEAAKVDSENQLLWRMNRQRLDFEAMRDTLLLLSGRLDLSQGGRSVEIASDDYKPRRTLYGFIERQNLPGLFRTFDFASPDLTSPQRFSTTVPQQALFLMNSPFIQDQVKSFLQRSDVASLPNDEARIKRLFQLAYQRQPDPAELRLALDFLNQPAAASESVKEGQASSPWQELVQVVMVSNELFFVD